MYVLFFLHMYMCANIHIYAQAYTYLYTYLYTNKYIYIYIYKNRICVYVQGQGGDPPQNTMHFEGKEYKL
jgi:hypothetical protein